MAEEKTVKEIAKVILRYRGKLNPTVEMVEEETLCGECNSAGKFIVSVHEYEGFMKRVEKAITLVSIGQALFADVVIGGIGATYELQDENLVCTVDSDFKVEVGKVRLEDSIYGTRAQLLEIIA